MLAVQHVCLQNTMITILSAVRHEESRLCMHGQDRDATNTQLRSLQSCWLSTSTSCSCVQLYCLSFCCLLFLQHPVPSCRVASPPAGNQGSRLLSKSLRYVCRVHVLIAQHFAL
jgi:hypothetical protein